MCYCCCCPPSAHTAVETKNHHKSFFSWGIMCVRTATKPMGWRIGMVTHSLILLHSLLLHGDCKNASILSATLLLLPVIAILFSKSFCCQVYCLKFESQHCWNVRIKHRMTFSRRSSLISFRTTSHFPTGISFKVSLIVSDPLKIKNSKEEMEQKILSVSRKPCNLYYGISFFELDTTFYQK